MIRSNGLSLSIDFQGCGLADAQATSIHERKAGPVDRVPYAAKQRADLSV
jgi:hypothetical protein